MWCGKERVSWERKDESNSLVAVIAICPLSLSSCFFCNVFLLLPLDSIGMINMLPISNQRPQRICPTTISVKFMTTSASVHWINLLLSASNSSSSSFTRSSLLHQTSTVESLEAVHLYEPSTCTNLCGSRFSQRDSSASSYRCRRSSERELENANVSIPFNMLPYYIRVFAF